MVNFLNRLFAAFALMDPRDPAPEGADPANPVNDEDDPQLLDYDPDEDLPNANADPPAVDGADTVMQDAPADPPGSPKASAGISAAQLTQLALLLPQLATVLASVGAASAGLTPVATTPVMPTLPPLHTNGLSHLMGPAQPFDGRSSWAKWVKQMIDRLNVLQVPLESWVAVILTLLGTSARDYADSNGITQSTPWEEFLDVMSKGPWAAKDTTFSLLFKLTRGTLGNGNPLEVVSQLANLRTKLKFSLPEQFWIFSLLVNLKEAFREALLVAPNGKEWVTYNELRDVVLSKAAAQKSANGATNPKPTPRSYAQATTGGGRPTTPRASTPRQDPGAGPSNPNPHKRKSMDGCFGCGSTSHKIGDKKPDGTPVCPNYDETRMRKGKYPTVPPKYKGNGKGK